MKGRRGDPRGAGSVALAAILAAGLLVSSGSPSAAQLGRKSWEFFPHIGPLFPSDPSFLTAVEGFDGLDPGVLWGIYATYHYTDYVGVELGFSKATANHPDGVLVPSSAQGLPAAGIGDASFDFWELNGFLNTGALKRLQVFATAGGGLVNYDPENGAGETRLLLDGGIGARYYAWKNIALRAEVKDFVFVDGAFSDYTGNPLPRPGLAVGRDRGGVDQQGSGEGPVGSKDTLHNVGVLAGVTLNF